MSRPVGLQHGPEPKGWEMATRGAERMTTRQDSDQVEIFIFSQASVILGRAGTLTEAQQDIFFSESDRAGCLAVGRQEPWQGENNRATLPRESPRQR